MADFRIGEPRGHHAAGDFVGNCGGFAGRAVIGFEGDWGDAVGAMTDYAVLLEDGEDVAVERWRWRWRGGLLLGWGGVKGGCRSDCKNRGKERGGCETVRSHVLHYPVHVGARQLGRPTYRSPQRLKPSFLGIVYGTLESVP